MSMQVTDTVTQLIEGLDLACVIVQGRCFIDVSSDPEVQGL